MLHNFVLFSVQVEVSPLETAIETLETTNKKIQGLVDQHNKDPSLKVDQLSMLLKGVVDPAVNKGILNYKVNMLFETFSIFLRKSYMNIFFSSLLHLFNNILYC